MRGKSCFWAVPIQAVIVTGAKLYIISMVYAVVSLFYTCKIKTVYKMRTQSESEQWWEAGRLKLFNYSLFLSFLPILQYSSYDGRFLSSQLQQSLLREVEGKMVADLHDFFLDLGSPA